MTETLINDFVMRFIRWHKGVEVKHSYNKEEQLHKFIMIYNNKCVDRLVSDLYLNLTICENPLPYLFDEMAMQLGVTLTDRWEYR